MVTTELIKKMRTLISPHIPASLTGGEQNSWQVLRRDQGEVFSQPAIARPRHRHRRERNDAAVTAMSVSSSSSKRPSRTPRPRLATCSGQVAVGDAMRHGACDGRVQLRQLPSCALVLLAECHHHRGHWDGRRRRKKALARKRLARAHPILTVHGSVPTVLGVHIVMQK